MTYITGNEKIDQEIENLAKKYSTPQTREYFRQLFTTVIKLYQDGAGERDLYLATTTLKELRHIFRTFAHYREGRKVVMFGSHRVLPDSREYEMAEDFARAMVEKGYMVITGGGGGVMEAGNKGAGRCGFAVKIKLPLESQANPYVMPGEKLLNVKYFFTRKLAFIKESDATVLFPGGFGTHDEGFEVLTLIQTGRALPRPIVCIEPKGGTYWKIWLNFVKKELLRGKYIGKADLGIFKIVHTVQEAVDAIIGFYRNYHSICYGKGYTVIRLQRRLPVKDLQRLSRKYKDIMMEGELTPSGPLPSEIRAQENLDLPRICFAFDRKSFSRLVALIWDINQI